MGGSCLYFSLPKLSFHLHVAHVFPQGHFPHFLGSVTATFHPLVSPSLAHEQQLLDLP